LPVFVVRAEKTFVVVQIVVTSKRETMIFPAGDIITNSTLLTASFSSRVIKRYICRQPGGRYFYRRRASGSAVASVYSAAAGSSDALIQHVVTQR